MFKVFSSHNRPYASVFGRVCGWCGGFGHDRSSTAFAEDREDDVLIYRANNPNNLTRSDRTIAKTLMHGWPDGSCRARGQSTIKQQKVLPQVKQPEQPWWGLIWRHPVGRLKVDFNHWNRHNLLIVVAWHRKWKPVGIYLIRIGSAETYRMQDKQELPVNAIPKSFQNIERDVYAGLLAGLGISKA